MISLKGFEHVLKGLPPTVINLKINFYPNFCWESGAKVRLEMTLFHYCKILIIHLEVGMFDQPL